MNRENKLAIIIGFSLVLVVAVLISDHFSRARNIESSGSDVKVGTAADFGAAPSGPTRTLGPQEPIPTSNRPLAGETMSRIEHVSDETPAHEPDVIDMGKKTPPAPPVTLKMDDEVLEKSRPWEDAPDAPAKPFSNGQMRFHDVKSGDMLYRLAVKYYGDGSLWKELAVFNKSKVSGESSVREGVRLEIPPKDVLLGEAVMPPPGVVRPVRENTGGRPKGEKPTPPDRQVAIGEKADKADKTKDAGKKKPVFNSYKILRGDDLSSIAKKLLGDARRAPELYKLNQDVLEDEHTLVAGTIIKVPAR